MSVKVSVLVPIYNVERFIGRCLDSLVAQTMGDIEIVLVNDASPDGSMEIARRYARRDSRVVIIDKPVNEGLMMARRTAIEAARGEWIFFIDSDDYMPSDTIERLYEVATRDRADIVVGNMYLENDSGRHVLRPRAHVAGERGEEYMTALLTWTTCSLCGSLFRRPILLGDDLPAIKGQLYSEDRILLTALLLRRHPRVAVANVTSYYYCLNHASATRVKMTDERLGRQLEALCLCHRYAADVAPQYNRLNDNFLLHYLSLFLENGYNRSIVENFNDTTRRLLRFDQMRKTTSLRFAIHTWLTANLPPYRLSCHWARGIIRRLQGKD